MATVTFDNVQKMYGDFQAVKDLNLEIGDGEFMVLVGPSGCGKTTSLRMIAGLEEISAGTLRIGDRVVNDVPPKDRDIAMVFQSYALYPHMSVRENLAFGLKLRKVPKPEIERRVNEAAETIQLQKEFNWCVDKLTYEKYGTKDPSKPGVYWMTAQEVSALTGALGDGPSRWIKSKVPPPAQQIVDNFKKEGQELSRANPPGSSWIEKIDCSKHASKIVIR